MRRLVLGLVLIASAALGGAAFAFDNGQYNDVPPDIRAWFRNVLAPNGVPCCDISDGHRTEYDVRNGAYWVPRRRVVRAPSRRHHHQLLRAGGRGVGWNCSSTG
jgi:hypothetical protein